MALQRPCSGSVISMSRASSRSSPSRHTRDKRLGRCGDSQRALTITALPVWALCRNEKEGWEK